MSVYDKLHKFSAGILVEAKALPASDYTWYTYQGARGKKLTNSRGKTVSIRSGSKFGIRESSNGKLIRLMTEELGPTFVFTITQAVNDSLIEKSKKARSTGATSKKPVGVKVKLKQPDKVKPRKVADADPAPPKKVKHNLKLPILSSRGRISEPTFWKVVAALPWPKVSYERIAKILVSEYGEEKILELGAIASDKAYELQKAINKQEKAGKVDVPFSDDGMDYFCDYMVSRGKEEFAKAKADPASAIKTYGKRFREGFAYCFMSDAYLDAAKEDTKEIMRGGSNSRKTSKRK